MQLPRFNLQSMLIAVLLTGAMLAGWDYAITRRRERETRDEYERLLRSMARDVLYTRDLFLRVDTLKAVVDKHGLTAEADAAWEAAKAQERKGLRE